MSAQTKSILPPGSTGNELKQFLGVGDENKNRAYQQLKPYQQAALDKLLSHFFGSESMNSKMLGLQSDRYVFAQDMGLGKTLPSAISILRVIEKMGGANGGTFNVLVISPPVLKDVWIDTLNFLKYAPKASEQGWSTQFYSSL